MNIEQLKEKTAYDGMPQAWQRGFNVAVREMQKEIEKLKAENERLKAAQWEFADLVESILPVIDRGGWSEISAELKTAITKARGN